MNLSGGSTLASVAATNGCGGGNGGGSKRSSAQLAVATWQNEGDSAGHPSIIPGAASSRSGQSDVLVVLGSQGSHPGSWDDGSFSQSPSGSTSSHSSGVAEQGKRGREDGEEDLQARKIARSAASGEQQDGSVDRPSAAGHPRSSRKHKRDNSKCSKYIGVRRRGPDRWVAEIKDTTHNVRRWLGTYPTEEEAARAFDCAAREIRGPNTRTNFPWPSTTPPEPMLQRFTCYDPNQRAGHDANPFHLGSHSVPAISGDHSNGDVFEVLQGGLSSESAPFPSPALPVHGGLRQAYRSIPAPVFARKGAALAASLAPGLVADVSEKAARSAPRLGTVAAEGHLYERSRNPADGGLAAGSATQPHQANPAHILALATALAASPELASHVEALLAASGRIPAVGASSNAVARSKVHPMDTLNSTGSAAGAAAGSAGSVAGRVPPATALFVRSPKLPVIKPTRTPSLGLSSVSSLRSVAQAAPPAQTTRSLARDRAEVLRALYQALKLHVGSLAQPASPPPFFAPSGVSLTVPVAAAGQEFPKTSGGNAASLAEQAGGAEGTPSAAAEQERLLAELEALIKSTPHPRHANAAGTAWPTAPKDNQALDVLNTDVEGTGCGDQEFRAIQAGGVNWATGIEMQGKAGMDKLVPGQQEMTYMPGGDVDQEILSDAFGEACGTEPSALSPMSDLEALLMGDEGEGLEEGLCGLSFETSAAETAAADEAALGAALLNVHENALLGMVPDAAGPVVPAGGVVQGWEPLPAADGAETFPASLPNYAGLNSSDAEDLFSVVALAGNAASRWGP